MATRADAAAEAIRHRLANRAFDLFVGLEGDYLRIKGLDPPRADISISMAELSDGRYSTQICLGGDPLDIVYDDECDLGRLLELCEQYVTRTRRHPE